MRYEITDIILRIPDTSTIALLDFQAFLDESETLTGLTPPPTRGADRLGQR